MEHAGAYHQIRPQSSKYICRIAFEENSRINFRQYHRFGYAGANVLVAVFTRFLKTTFGFDNSVVTFQCTSVHRQPESQPFIWLISEVSTKHKFGHWKIVVFDK